MQSKKKGNCSCFNDLVDRSYLAIQKRGLINENTSLDDFYLKLKEEFKEFKIELFKNGWIGPNERTINELADFLTVGIMLLRHYNIDFVKEFEKVIIKNENRCH